MASRAPRPAMATRAPRSAMAARAPRSAMAARAPLTRHGRPSPLTRHGSRNGRRPGGLLSCPVSVCLEASRAPTPPPRWMVYGAGRTVREGGVMSDLCSLCLVFPLLSCPYLVSSCSCPRFLILVN